MPGDAQATVVGRPVAIAQEVGRGIVGEQPEELGVLRISEWFQEATSEHVEPGFQSALAILQRSGAIEEERAGDLDAAAFEDGGVLRDAGEIPGVQPLGLGEA